MSSKGKKPAGSKKGSSRPTAEEETAVSTVELHPLSGQYGRIVLEARRIKDGLHVPCSIESVAIPACCPVLGSPIEVGPRGEVGNLPIALRLDDSLGFEPGNVAVFSQRGARLLTDYTEEELRTALEFLSKGD